MADTNNGNIAVLNPVGYPPKITPKSMAPRLGTLDGKTIYWSIHASTIPAVFAQVKDWFAEHMPSVKTELVEMSSVYTKDDPKTWEMIKANGEAPLSASAIEAPARRRSPCTQSLSIANTTCPPSLSIQMRSKKPCNR
jgi:hypothetical protein